MADDNDCHAQQPRLRDALSLQIAVPVRMDDGRLRTFTGWRVQYGTFRGPAKGGFASTRALVPTR